MLQLMAGAERLCHIFKWGREMKKVGNHCRLYGLSAFSNRHAVLRKLYVWQQKRKFGTVVNISLPLKYENYEKLENVKT